MKQLTGSEPVIIIEWDGHALGEQSTLDARHVSKDELLNLARALGRLQARRDLARGAVAGTPERLSSGAISSRMKAKAQV
ncbi:hypothetical protein [Ralstonia sp.]|uniref:hypothetical protein n=1 Tax=Ralstonia sp. TaxID=54061 RepID=UPI00257A28C3|nr:hypothetical protein [Ralstonia sp.]